MSLKPKTVVEYDWFDIQQEICKRMGIEEKHFRRYHELVGGDYKDLWHVCLDSVVPDNMANDTTVFRCLIRAMSSFARTQSLGTVLRACV